jgi:hypothetical protein
VYCQKYDDYQRAFYESEFRQYWIINKKECCRYSLDTINIKTKYSNVYGPFKEEEFWKKRNELGVSDTLQIREYYKPTKPKDWRTYFIPKMRKGEQRQ